MFILTITAQAQFLTNNSFFKMFQDSINMYRNSLGLTNVVLEPKYKNFVDQHSYYQARLGYRTHGEGNFTFEKRVEKERVKRGYTPKKKTKKEDYEKNLQENLDSK